MVRLSLILAMAAAMPCSAQTKPGTAPVEHVKPSADQAVRRAESEKYCKDRGIPVYNNPYALFTEPESKVVIRDKDAGSTERSRCFTSA